MRHAKVKVNFCAQPAAERFQKIGADLFWQPRIAPWQVVQFNLHTSPAQGLHKTSDDMIIPRCAAKGAGDAQRLDFWGKVLRTRVSRDDKIMRATDGLLQKTFIRFCHVARIKPQNESKFMRLFANLLKPKPSLPQVAILSPIKDVADLAADYFRRLRQLSFPHEKLSIGLLESDSRDGTFAAFQSQCERMRGEFRRVELWKRDFNFQVPEGQPRWLPEIQAERRAVLARSRNHLLFLALGDADWALWLDADVIEFPTDIIQQLLAFNRDIVHPHCVKKYGGPSYDLNAWCARGSRHLHDLRGGTELVELEAVGGTMLLVRADRHRDGLIFPPFYYGANHRFARPKELNPIGGEIETEGFGLLAADMNLKCWGVPGLEIRHRDL